MNAKKVFFNMIWRFAERSGAQIVSFAVSIVLARILEPSVYGTVALITVFINFLQVFVESGLGNSLIQKKNADDTDFNTVFYFNIFFCICIYALLYICAPVIARFYENHEMVLMIRVLGLTIVISGVKNIQQAYVSRNMLFKKFFFSTLGGTVASAFVGIGLALAGYGVWALIIQQFSNLLIDTVVLWFLVQWRPRLVFSLTRLKQLFSYGWKLLVSSLIDGLYTNLTSLIVGKKYSPSDLAFYNQGHRFPIMVVTNINSAIDSVLLPVMSKEQDEIERVKYFAKLSLKVSMFVMAPLMIGMAAIGYNLVDLILGEKWLECVIFMQIFCITYLFWPIHTTNLNVIKALGRSDLFLKLEIVKKCIGVILVVLAMNISVEAIAICMLLNSIFSQIINAYPNGKILGYGYMKQLMDIFPTLLISSIMGIVVWVIGDIIDVWLPLELMLQIFVGGVVYILGAKVFRFKEIEIIYNIISKRGRRNG